MSQIFVGCTVLWFHSAFKAHTNSLNMLFKLQIIFRRWGWTRESEFLSPRGGWLAWSRDCVVESPDPK